MDDSLLREAGHLALVDALVRTADAIHVVSALRMELSAFTSYNRWQALMADAVGVVVTSPGLPAGWCRAPLA